MSIRLIPNIRQFLTPVIVLMLCVSVTSCKVSKHNKHQYMKKAYLSIRDSFSNAEVKLIQDSIKIIFPDEIMFHTAESEVLPAFMQHIEQFAKFFQHYHKTSLLVTGHTDNTGEESFNDKLSARRAENVKMKLVEYHIAPQRITTWGLGAKSPAASNKTTEGRSKNRRVEFVILYDSNL